jgi:predicted dithiol-disulfide oxidoreductase (DUF899 family)
MNEKIVELESKILKLEQELLALRSQADVSAVGSYIFNDENGEINLIDLFDGRRDLMVVHNMGAACSYCTAYADGFNGVLEHILNRTSFVVSSPDLPQEQLRFAQSRDWKFKMVSTNKTTFEHDMGFEDTPGDHWPGVSTFSLSEDGTTVIRVAYTSFDPGDSYSPIWPLFSLLRHTDVEWGPKISYSDAKSPMSGHCSTLQ